MKFHVTVSALVGCTVFLAGCGNEPTAPAAAGTSAREAVTANPQAAAPASAPVVSGTPLGNNAPAFASLYPDAALTKPVLTAKENGNDGGIAEFTTPDSPEKVMDHYRQLADNNGLSPVMAMNQGSARAFAAKNKNGAELQVVASTSDEGLTSVQLTWQAAN